MSHSSDQTETDTEADPVLDFAETDNGDIILPTPPLDPVLIAMHKYACDFVAQVIVSMEEKLYDTSYTLFKSQMPQNSDEDIRTKVNQFMTTTSDPVVKCLEEMTKFFYNNLYYSLQKEYFDVPPEEQVISQFEQIIPDLKAHAKTMDYPPHVLLDKLFRLNVDLHFDILREKLSAFTKEELCMTLATQINLYLTDVNTIKFLARGEDDEITLVYRNPKNPDDAPFQLEIELTKS